jgi:hypothetical protein
MKASPRHTHNWKDVRVVGKLKQSNIHKKETLFQMERYVQDATRPCGFRCKQPYRRLAVDNFDGVLFKSDLVLERTFSQLLASSTHRKNLQRGAPVQPSSVGEIDILHGA